MWQQGTGTSWMRPRPAAIKLRALSAVPAEPIRRTAANHLLLGAIAVTVSPQIAAGSPADASETGDRAGGYSPLP
jgi:hypothetical protein